MSTTGTARNIALLPWISFAQSLLFWQAVWFLYFQSTLSAAEAILLYVVYDVATTVLEVPSGYMSDRLGRRLTLIASAVAATLGALLLAVGGSFAAFALAQICLGAATAFWSGTGSSMLYESLKQEGRAAEVERQELRLWRVMFVALALSAAAGGLLARWSETAPFWATALAGLWMLALTLRLSEPTRKIEEYQPLGAQLRVLRGWLTRPVLLWLFGLSVALYVLGHVPFVFGQPFILEALEARGLAGEAPVISGAVSATMMVLSVLASLVAWRLRARIGLAAMLLLALAMQLGLIGALALSNAPWVIALLFLRMVPSSLTTPFIQARIQPELSDDLRATFLSLKSFVGRIIFAVTLYWAAGSSNTAGQMGYAEMQVILLGFVLGGLAVWLALALTARRAGLEARDGPVDA